MFFFSIKCFSYGHAVCVVSLMWVNKVFGCFKQLSRFYRFIDLVYIIIDHRLILVPVLLQRTITDQSSGLNGLWTRSFQFLSESYRACRICIRSFCSVFFSPTHPLVVMSSFMPTRAGDCRWERTSGFPPDHQLKIGDNSDVFKTSCCRDLNTELKLTLV